MYILLNMKTMTVTHMMNAWNLTQRKKYKKKFMQRANMHRRLMLGIWHKQCCRSQRCLEYF